MVFPIKISVLTSLLTTSWVCLAQAEPQGDTEQRIRVLVAYHSMTGNTEKMAKAVAEGAASVPATIVELQRVGEVTGEQLLASDAVVVGSPVYWANMAGEVKTFFDNWQLKFGIWPGFKMRDRVGAAFATGKVSVIPALSSSTSVCIRNSRCATRWRPRSRRETRSQVARSSPC